MRIRVFAFAATALGVVPTAHAQRADENIVRAANDAFGVALGNDKIGLYNDRDVRGFSPVAASNVRVEGLYFDMRGNLPSRILASTQIKVGITAQGYAFPAPTGIVDYQLKSIGEKAVTSVVVQAGPNEGWSYELEVHRPIDGKRFGIMAGAIFQRQAPAPGLTVQPYSFGAVARWRPASTIDVTAFAGHYDRLDGEIYPSLFTSGAFLPPDVKAERFSQEWVKSDITGKSYGAAARDSLTENWTLRAGVFRYFQLNSGNITETYLNTDASGVAASRRFSRDPQNKLNSYSGEARLTGIFTGERWQQTIHVSVRARAAMRTFGGAGQVFAGPVQIGAEGQYAEPSFALGPTTRDEVNQSGEGISYAVGLRGFGEIGAGVQKVQYEKTVTPPVAAETVTKDGPILHNLALAVSPSDRLLLYASFARGLEDPNTAPDVAVNANASPPAIRTKQWDAGFRYALTPRLKVIAGYFHIEKPYFNLDPSNFYRQLGDETHAGVEVSLAGAVGDHLNLVAGAVLMKPEVTGEAVTSGQIGELPVGQTKRAFKVNADYRIGAVKGLSVDAAFNYAARRAASSRTFAALGDQQLMTQDYTTLDLGARYHFKAFGGNPATLRVQALNVTDAFAWQVQGSGALQISNPRAFQASLAVDF